MWLRVDDMVSVTIRRTGLDVDPLCTGAPREGHFEALAQKAAGRRFSDEE